MVMMGVCYRPQEILKLDCNLADCSACCDGSSGGNGGNGGGGTGTGFVDPTTGGPAVIPPIPTPKPAGNITLVFNPTTNKYEWVSIPGALPSPTAAGQVFISNGAGAADTNSEWVGPGSTGQYLVVNAAGALVFVTPPEYLINEELTVTLAANTPSVVLSTLLKNIDTYKLINTANGQEVTDSLDSLLLTDKSIQIQASVPITVKVEMIGPKL
jgi:hypothetical protein